MDHHRPHYQTAKWFVAAILLLLVNTAFAQTTTVSGIVMDADTKDPIPFASVYFKGAKGTTADSTGHFELNTARIVNQLVASYIGYKTKTVSIKNGAYQTIDIELKLDASKDLSGVTIKSKKKINYHNLFQPHIF